MRSSQEKFNKFNCLLKELNALGIRQNERRQSFLDHHKNETKEKLFFVQQNRKKWESKADRIGRDFSLCEEMVNASNSLWLKGFWNLVCVLNAIFIAFPLTLIEKAFSPVYRLYRVLNGKFETKRFKFKWWCLRRYQDIFFRLKVERIRWWIRINNEAQNEAKGD